jgi:glyoxylate/succinic semialdehyde reductase
MVEGRFPTAFPLKHQRKDMRLALELGKALKQDLTVAAAADDLYVTVRHSASVFGAGLMST